MDKTEKKYMVMWVQHDRDVRWTDATDVTMHGSGVATFKDKNGKEVILTGAYVIEEV